MKIWKKYSRYLLSGEWHIHTTYTDGKSSVGDYCKRAGEIGIPLIAFTEHVRKDLDYDFNAYRGDIEHARETYDLIILSGCEAKVLPDGTLDVEDSILRQVDYPIFAFHSFPEDLDTYLDALHTVLKNNQVNTWAHPGVFLKKSGMDISEEELSRIMKMLRDNEILIELNRKYDAPPAAWIDLAKRYHVNFVRGSDCHQSEEMR
jgi:DNA polymerase (family 10)/putative hydrolase